MTTENYIHFRLSEDQYSWENLNRISNGAVPEAWRYHDISAQETAVMYAELTISTIINIMKIRHNVILQRDDFTYSYKLNSIFRKKDEFTLSLVSNEKRQKYTQLIKDIIKEVVR